MVEISVQIVSNKLKQYSQLFNLNAMNLNDEMRKKYNYKAIKAL